MRYDYTMYNILNDGDEVILALPNFFIVKCINGFEQCLPKSQKLLYDTGNKIIWKPFYYQIKYSKPKKYTVNSTLHVYIYKRKFAKR